MYVYDRADIGFQSPLDIFQPNGSFCNNRCPAQHEAPIWGADFCNYGYGQPIHESQTESALGTARPLKHQKRFLFLRRAYGTRLISDFVSAGTSVIDHPNSCLCFSVRDCIYRIKVSQNYLI